MILPFAFKKRDTHSEIAREDLLRHPRLFEPLHEARRAMRRTKLPLVSG